VKCEKKREKCTNPGLLLINIVLIMILLFLFNEFTYLCVCGDDHVTRYMGADVNVGGQTET